MPCMSFGGDIAEAWLMCAAAEDAAALRLLLMLAVFCCNC